MRIDGHLHFTAPERFAYPAAFDAGSTEEKGHTPDWLRGPFKRSRFDGAIAVQATSDPAEARWLLDVAGPLPHVLGVVTRADPANPRLPYLIDSLQRHAKFRGLGACFSGDRNPYALLQSQPLGGLREMARRSLPLDLRLAPGQLALAKRLAESVPELQIVVSHPPGSLATGRLDEQWGAGVETLGSLPQIFVQVPTLGAGSPPGWKAAAESLKPPFGHLLRTLGPSRLLFATDWPVCLAAVETWKQALAAFTQALGAQTMDDRSLILGENAARLYGLDPSRLDAPLDAGAAPWAE